MTREWYKNKVAEYTKAAAQAKFDLESRIKNNTEMPDSCKEKLMSLLANEDERYIAVFLTGDFRNILFRAFGLKRMDVYTRLFKELNVEAYARIIEKRMYADNLLDSAPVSFDGDIIITDPCYVVKDLDESSRPKWEDFMKLDDYSGMTPKEQEEAGFDDDYARLCEAQQEWDDKHPKDWDVCNCGHDMDKLGLRTWMTRDTIYGDWSCTVFSNTNEELGKFCADTGKVSVFQLDEVLKYNPDFNYHIEKPWTTALIKDFKGTVQFIVEEVRGVHKRDIGKTIKAGDIWVEHVVHVVGEGVNKVTGERISFKSSQTGF